MPRAISQKSIISTTSHACPRFFIKSKEMCHKRWTCGVLLIDKGKIPGILRRRNYELVVYGCIRRIDLFVARKLGVEHRTADPKPSDHHRKRYARRDRAF